MSYKFQSQWNTNLKVCWEKSHTKHLNEKELKSQSLQKFAAMENAKGNKKLMQMAKKQKAKVQINTKYNVM